MYGVSVRQHTPPGAHQDSQAGLLEDVHIVVVGVPHGPARGVPLGLLAAGRVHQATVTVRPLLPLVELTHLNIENKS